MLFISVNCRVLIALASSSDNYYPINTAASIRDERAQFTVLTDRSQGGGSVHPNQLEIMVHRRNLHDDHLGVGEPLNEPGLDGKGLVVRGIHRLIVTKPSRALAMQRFMMERIAHPIAPKYASGLIHLAKPSYSALKKNLPSNIHIVTLDRIRDGVALLRLGHLFAVNEDAMFSSAATVELSSLFDDRCIEDVVELNLSANQYRADMHKRRWSSASNEDENDFMGTFLDKRFSVTLKPMQIKTWQVTFAKSCPGAHVDTQ